MKKLIFLLTLALFILGGCKNSQSIEKEKKVELTVSAAVSLSDALAAIKEVYEKNQPVELTFNFGGSGNLAQQIRQGAPVDVFISANEEWMDLLEKENLIIASTRQEITGNKIVMITGTDSKFEYNTPAEISAMDVENIAIGNPESVPAGKYAEEILHNLNKWDELKEKFVLAKDARQVLTYVETGNADIGFVYESDALSSPNIKVLAAINETLHEPIVYPGAAASYTKHKEEAEAFLNFLQSEKAQDVLVRHGFKKSAR